MNRRGHSDEFTLQGMQPGWISNEAEQSTSSNQSVAESVLMRLQGYRLAREQAWSRREERSVTGGRELEFDVLHSLAETECELEEDREFITISFFAKFST
uniref:Uncharacterized protein n=1 Tax=Setaria digitata TaxID=48799 RepID=A0A915Q4J9_9BILA